MCWFHMGEGPMYGKDGWGSLVGFEREYEGVSKNVAKIIGDESEIYTY